VYVYYPRDHDSAYAYYTQDHDSAYAYYTRDHESAYTYYTRDHDSAYNAFYSIVYLQPARPTFLYRFTILYTWNKSNLVFVGTQQIKKEKTVVHMNTSAYTA